MFLKGEHNLNCGNWIYLHLSRDRSFSQSSQAIRFCQFLFLLSGLAISELWGIIRRKCEVQAVAPSFTSVYFSQNWDFSTEKQEIINRPLYVILLTNVTLINLIF